MKRILWILTGLSATILLLSLNRLTSITSGYLQPFEFLRFLDFNAMIPIPLASILLYYLLLREVVGESPFSKTKTYTYLFLIFITGVYLFGASSGTHEVTNYLNQRFCEKAKVQTQICTIVSFNDDEFSHIVYYIGFILMNVALMISQYKVSFKEGVGKSAKAVISANAIFIGLGIFANLAFEEIGLDLYFFGSMMLLALYLYYKRPIKTAHYPVLFYFAISYSFGVLGTLAYKAFVS